MTYLKASDILAFSVLMNLFHLVDFYFTNEKLNGTFIQNIHFPTILTSEQRYSYQVSFGSRCYRGFSFIFTFLLMIFSTFTNRFEKGLETASKMQRLILGSGRMKNDILHPTICK